MGGAFYEPLGDGRFRSTEHTVGPWAADSQHLGPPSALLTRALELVAPGGTAPFAPRVEEGAKTAQQPALARVTVEILGPVPVTELEVRAGVERPGRSVELLSGEIRAGGRTVVRGRAWRITRSDTTAVLAGAGEPLDPPERGRQGSRPNGWGSGYLDAMEWRPLRGDFTEPGPATIWARQQVDLVTGESPTGLQRLLAVADSGNGASARLDIREWWFINTELTVHVYRVPEGEWICLDADTMIGPHGVGTAHSVLHDRAGPVAFGAQALMVRPR